MFDLDKRVKELTRKELEAEFKKCVMEAAKINAENLMLLRKMEELVEQKKVIVQ